MSTVRLKNRNPIGQVDLPLIGRQGDPLGTPGVGCLEPGEEFDVSPEHAAILLQQAGNYEPVDDAAKTIAAAVSGVPVRSAAKADWVTYAQARGDTDAPGKTKDQLIDEHGDAAGEQ